MSILIVYTYSSQTEKKQGHKIYEERMFENFILIKFNENHKLTGSRTLNSFFITHLLCVIIRHARRSLDL